MGTREVEKHRSKQVIHKTDRKRHQLESYGSEIGVLQVIPWGSSLGGMESLQEKKDAAGVKAHSLNEGDPGLIPGAS